MQKKKTLGSSTPSECSFLIMKLLSGKLYILNNNTFYPFNTPLKYVLKNVLSRAPVSQQLVHTHTYDLLY